MTKYVAFLRGINIGGKNKIAMSDLKAEFEGLGFADVSTYLNSGNIVFSVETDNLGSDNSRAVIEEMLTQKFGLEIPTYVIKMDQLNDIFEHSPKWWGTGNKEKYDNLIFILSQDTPEEICALIREPSEGLESVQPYKNVIFWTFDRKSFSKCRWWKKTASPEIAEKLTIRTANTVRKICK